jgi:hypothetical protein
MQAHLQDLHQLGLLHSNRETGKRIVGQVCNLPTSQYIDVVVYPFVGQLPRTVPNQVRTIGAALSNNAFRYNANSCC